MTLAPRFLVSFWAGLRAAQFARRAKSEVGAVAAQEATFRHLMSRMAATELGRQQGLHPAMDYETFQQGQPLVEHRHFEALIDRMVRGEENVIWPGRCQFFVDTAGTTLGNPRRLPVTDELLAHYRAGVTAALLHYVGRARHGGVFLGRHLHAGASIALQETGGSFTGNFDGITALSLSKWAEANLHSPPAAIARMPDGAEKAAATADAMRSEDVTLIGGTPASVRLLADAVRSREAAEKSG